jgi:hypothetical protein
MLVFGLVMMVMMVVPATGLVAGAGTRRFSLAALAIKAVMGDERG